MFSLDQLIAQYIPIIIDFLLANKFSIISMIYILDKCAKYSKTTVDDKIVTFIKNIFYKAIGTKLKVPITEIKGKQKDENSDTK